MTDGQTNKKMPCCQTSNNAKKTWVPVYSLLNNTTLIFSLRGSLQDWWDNRNHKIGFDSWGHLISVSWSRMRRFVEETNTGMDPQHISRDADLGIICESGLWIFSIFVLIFFLFERFQCFDKMPLQHFIKMIQQLFLSVRKAFIAMITEDIQWRRFVSQTFCLILIYLADDIATESKCLYPAISGMRRHYWIILWFWAAWTQTRKKNCFELLITVFTFILLSAESLYKSMLYDVQVNVNVSIIGSNSNIYAFKLIKKKKVRILLWKKKILSTTGSILGIHLGKKR